MRKAIKSKDAEEIIEAKKYLDMAKELLESKILNNPILDYIQQQQIKRKYIKLENSYLKVANSNKGY